MPERTCSVAGCWRPARATRARRLCKVHHKKLRKYGDPEWRYVRPSEDETFLSKFDGPSPTACWVWTGTLYLSGYGKFEYGGRQHLAHRYSYQHFVGAIGDGLTIDHLCRNRACVNPSHLEPVTSAENTRRGGAAKTHCKHGHAYTPENTARYTGRRSCKTCNRLRAAAYRRKKDTT